MGGPMALYFGARKRKEEFLYGEKLEVYIQHKMNEDGKLLADWLLKKGGAFYLCGPTWPVPDIYNALIKAFQEYGGLTEQQAKDKIDELKEEERYVLEVY